MDIAKIAKLARLRLDEQEAAALSKDLEAILAYAKELEALDLSNVQPTSHASQVGTQLRQDEPRDGLSVHTLHAPALDGTSFKVPKVIE